MTHLLRDFAVQPPHIQQQSTLGKERFQYVWVPSRARSTEKENSPPHLFSPTLLDLATDTSGKTENAITMYKWVGRTVHIHASFTNTNDFEFNMNLRFKSFVNYQKHWLFLCFSKPEVDLALLPWAGGYGIQYQRRKCHGSSDLKQAQVLISAMACPILGNPDHVVLYCFSSVAFFMNSKLNHELKENSTPMPRYLLPVPRVKLTSRTWRKWQSSECGDTPGAWKHQTLPQGFFPSDNKDWKYAEHKVASLVACMWLRRLLRVMLKLTVLCKKKRINCASII